MTLNDPEGRGSALTYSLSMPIRHVVAAGEHHVATASWVGGAVRVWEVNDPVRPHRSCVFTIVPPMCLASSPAGFLTGFRDGTYIRWQIIGPEG